MPRETSTAPADLQLDWNPEGVRAGWFDRIDNNFLIDRLLHLTPEVSLRGHPRRVLDVAAAEGIHTADLALAGVDAVALDPSPAMMMRSREEMARRGTRFTLVRGIGETMPFRDGAFDCVLCHGAIDHVADPALAVREMTRVLSPDGRLVISGVNYEGMSVRISRILYGLGRRFGMIPPTAHLYWDSPVPVEHSFECSYRRLRRLCEPYLEFDHVIGVSLGAGLPGWGEVLARLRNTRALALLRGLDALAARAPAAADFVYTVWRPRPRAAWPVPRPPADGGFVVQPDDLTYPYKAARERHRWAGSDFAGSPFPRAAVERRMTNAEHTGDPARTWLDDLMGRGPFATAAVLGCDEERFDRAWLAGGGSPTLDVYDLSPAAIAAVRQQLGALAPRARFIETDLNFAELPVDRYEVVWSSGSLHHITNLEHLFAQVERSLHPGGLFAMHDYVGERRLQYARARLARVNALLHEVPPRWRRHGVERIEPPDPNTLGPFCGVRSAEMLPLAEARFEVLHKAFSDALFPLAMYLDLDAIARDAPALLERLQAAEADALHDPATPPCGVYAVFRRRG